MSVWITEAREDLAGVLRAVVFTADHAGRAQPYPPRPDRVLRPSVWISGEHSGYRDDAGRHVAVFQVTGVVDGKLEAADAMRDAMLSAAIDGCASMPGLKPVRWRCQPVTIEATNTAEQYRGFVLEIEATATTRTFATPVPMPAEIPPVTYAEV